MNTWQYFEESDVSALFFALRFDYFIAHKMKKIFHLIFLVFLSPSSWAQSVPVESADWQFPNRTIVIGGDYNFPPYEFLDKDGNPAGYNVEMSQAIAETMGIDIEIILGGWDDMRNGLNAGEIDVLQGMTITEDRQKIISFSPPNVTVQQSIFARDGTPAVKNLSDLRNKKVIVQSQGSMHDYLLSNDFTEDEIVPVSTHVDALRVLSSGKYDYAIVANLPGLYVGREHGLSNLIIVGRPFSAGGYTYAVLKGNEGLLSQFSEGMAILKNTGRQQEIYDKWLGVLEEDPIPWEQLGLFTLVLSVVLLLLIGLVSFWNRSLKIQVDKRSDELKQHQQQLIQADKMSSLGVLVSGVAHEINNPTGLLLLNLPLVKDVWKDLEKIIEEIPEEQLKNMQLAGLSYKRIKDEFPMVIDEMHEGAIRIKRIVEDLKDFARYESESFDQLTDVNIILQAAIRLVENPIRKSTDHFSVHYDPTTPKVYASAQRIEQVLVNLLLNACQALRSRSEKVAVTVVTSYKDNVVTISVEDEGCGIDRVNLDNLTDPFFTTKREVGGTGLGLSVSASIVKSHGGKLEFKSKKNEGTKVTLSLPLPIYEKAYEQ